MAGADHVLVDMHAEATSEKVAMGWYLDGRVTAVVGTHTHVPTADARVLPGGTAYISDVGMTGARGGVIGVKREQSISVIRSQMPIRYDASETTPGSWRSSSAPRPAPRAPRRSSRCSAPPPPPAPPPLREHGEDHEREEPHDVEVDPVRHRELDRDQGRGADSAARADQVTPARDERDDDGEGEHGGPRGAAARGGRGSPRPRTGDSRSAWKPSVRS